MNIAELKTKPAQTMLTEGLIAIVTDVMARKTGTSRNGDWSLQPIALKDDSGEMKAIIWNRDDLAGLKGKTINLSAYKTDRGWMGCYVEDNEYQGKTYTQIKASGNFILEEYKAPEPKENGGGQAATNGNGNHAPTLPVWGEYCAVVRAAHKMAREIEPDFTNDAGFTTDRARARVALVGTILIAYGKHDFKYELTDDDIPF